MVNMAMRCSSCIWTRHGSTSATLLEAQDHASETGHEIRVTGVVSSAAKDPVYAHVPDVADKEALAQAAALKRLREAEILRRARDKGLLRRSV